MSLGLPGSDLPRRAQELQEEEGSPGRWGAPTLPPRPPQTSLHGLAHGHSLESKRKPPGKVRQGPQTSSEKEDTSMDVVSRGTFSCSVGLSTLRTTLVRDPANRSLPSPCPPEAPLGYGPLSTSPVGGKSRAVLQGPGRTGLDPWGWSAGRICGFFPKFWSSREGVTCTLGARLGQPLGSEGRAAGNGG